MSRDWVDAALSGDLGKIQELIAQGGEPVGDSLGHTPLMLAAMRGHAECVQALLAVSNPEEKSNLTGATAFDLALKKGQTACGKILTTPATRARLSKKDPSTRRTRLMEELGKRTMNIEEFERQEALIDFLAEHSDIEAQDPKKKTALHWAAERSAQSVAALLKRGAKTDVKDRRGWTPLVCAINQGLDDAALLLAECAGFEEKDADGQTAAHHAALFCEPVLRALIKKGAKIDSPDAKGRRPLMRAAFVGNHGSVAALLEAPGVDARAPDASGRTPFAAAMAIRRKRMVQALAPWATEAELAAAKEILGERATEWLGGAASPEADPGAPQEPRGKAPEAEKTAKTAGSEKDPEAAAEAAGAAEAAEADGAADAADAIKRAKRSMSLTSTEVALGSKLWDSVTGRKAEALRKAIRSGAPVLPDPGQGGATPLMIAAKTWTRFFSLLPMSDLEERDEQGRTALMHAAEGGGPNIVEKILEGSDATATDNEGHSALMIAAAEGNAAAALVLAPQSDVKAKSHLGATALMMAAGAGLNGKKGKQGYFEPQLVEALVNNLLPMSDAKARDKKGRSAFAWASLSGSMEAMEALASFATLEEAQRAVKKHGAAAIPKIKALAEAMELAQTLRGQKPGAGPRANPTEKGATGEDATNKNEPKRRRALSL